jgi:hypothetical protein
VAVQNAVDYKDLGVATSGATLFRSIGGSVGTAILGSIFASQLKSNLTGGIRSNPAVVAGMSHSQVTGLSGAIGNPQSLKALRPALHDLYITSFTNALNTVFVVAAGVAAAAFVLSWLLPERPLRDTAEGSTGIGESFAVPKPDDSLAELSRALSVLVGHERRRQLVAQITAQAGVDLSPAAAWLLVRKHRDPEATLGELSAQWDVPLDRAEAGRSELGERGMMSPDGELITEPDHDSVTVLGHETAERLIAARRDTLARLLEGWEPEQHAEVTMLLTRLAEELQLAPAEAGSKV